jgi:hypothetical protein
MDRARTLQTYDEVIREFEIYKQETKIYDIWCFYNE